MLEFLLPAVFISLLLMLPLYKPLKEYVYSKALNPADAMEMVMILGGSVFIGMLIKNIAAGALLAMCGFMFQKHRKVLQEKAYKQKIDSQAEIALQMIAALYSTTSDLVMAFEATSKVVGDPMSSELLFTVKEYRAGKPWSRALLDFAERMGNRDIEVFVKGVLLSEKYGSQTEDVVLNVAQIIRDRITLQEEIKNETKGQGLVINLFLSAIPIALVASFLFMPDARYTLMETVGGKFLVCFLILLEYGAWWVSRAMMGVADDL